MKNEERRIGTAQCVHFYVTVRSAFFNLTSSFLILNLKIWNIY